MVLLLKLYLKAMVFPGATVVTFGKPDNFIPEEGLAGVKTGKLTTLPVAGTDGVDGVDGVVGLVITIGATGGTAGVGEGRCCTIASATSSATASATTATSRCD